MLHAWQGLGYYARARNLHRCAQILVRDRGGRFPDTEAGLRDLPGIGAYTAAAIAAIAFGGAHVPVDGNIERVMSRLFTVREPLPRAKPALRAHAARFASAHRPGDLAQAMMDLGATVCTPKSPRCDLCPWRADCRAHADGIVADLPMRAKAATRPRRFGVAYWVERGAEGAILLRRRSEKGLLGGMMEIPCTPFRATPWGDADAKRAAPLAARWRAVPGTVRHVFTHFDLDVRILAASTGPRAKADGIWCLPQDLGRHALPALMKKIIRHARAAKEDKDRPRPPIPSRRAVAGAARRSR
ncbi:MAG: NUDIX domain-containing protein [Alphaproteobacteria bacterium]